MTEMEDKMPGIILRHQAGATNVGAPAYGPVIQEDAKTLMSKLHLRQEGPNRWASSVRDGIGRTIEVVEYEFVKLGSLRALEKEIEFHRS